MVLRKVHAEKCIFFLINAIIVHSITIMDDTFDEFPDGRAWGCGPAVEKAYNCEGSFRIGTWR